MQLNQFYSAHTLYINGRYFEGGRWTEAWETPELIAKVRAGLMKTVKPIEQVAAHISPPVVTMQVSPVVPIAQAAQVDIHPSFAPAVELTEELEEATAEPMEDDSFNLLEAETTEPEAKIKPSRKKPQ